MARVVVLAAHQTLMPLQVLVVQGGMVTGTGWAGPQGAGEDQGLTQASSRGLLLISITCSRGPQGQVRGVDTWEAHPYSSSSNMEVVQGLALPPQHLTSSA